MQIHSFISLVDAGHDADGHVQTEPAKGENQASFAMIFSEAENEAPMPMQSLEEELEAEVEGAESTAEPGEEPRTATDTSGPKSEAVLFGMSQQETRPIVTTVREGSKPRTDFGEAKPVSPDTLNLAGLIAQNGPHDVAERPVVVAVADDAPEGQIEQAFTVPGPKIGQDMPQAVDETVAAVRQVIAPGRSGVAQDARTVPVLSRPEALPVFTQEAPAPVPARQAPPVVAPNPEVNSEAQSPSRTGPETAKPETSAEQGPDRPTSVLVGRQEASTSRNVPLAGAVEGAKIEAMHNQTPARSGNNISETPRHSTVVTDVTEHFPPLPEPRSLTSSAEPQRVSNSHLEAPVAPRRIAIHRAEPVGSQQMKIPAELIERDTLDQTGRVSGASAVSGLSLGSVDGRDLPFARPPGQSKLESSTVVDPVRPSPLSTSSFGFPPAQDRERSEPISTIKIVAPAPTSQTIPALESAQLPSEPEFGEAPALEGVTAVGDTTRANTNPVSPSGAIAQVHTPRFAVQMAEYLVKFQERGVELTLNPEELGRIRMSLNLSETGAAVTIVAERPETVDLLKRNSDLLSAALRDLGHLNIQFDFGERGQAEHAWPHSADTETADPDLVLGADGLQKEPVGSPVSPTTGLDLRL